MYSAVDVGAQSSPLTRPIHRRSHRSAAPDSGMCKLIYGTSINPPDRAAQGLFVAEDDDHDCELGVIFQIRGPTYTVRQ